MIDQQKIDLIKTTSTDNIVEVIGEFVHLKRKGAQYVGLSPFSNERTPSFMVHPAKGLFKDFSSGKGGDVIEFLMQIQNWKFNDALKYLAKKFGIDIENNDMVYTAIPREKPEPKPADYIQPSDLTPTLANYDKNPLFNFLCLKYDQQLVSDAFKKYYVGVHQVLTDWIIFWLVDIHTYIRSGKYIKYLSNGHRCKETSAGWQHTMTKEYQPVYPNFNFVQCFFGEHLLEDIKKSVAIVESEKTAIIASMVMDKYIWLACGSKNGLNDTKCSVLSGRSVTLFPDLGAYDEWKAIAKKYSWSVSDILEKRATDEQRKAGLDLADFLLM